MADPGDVIAHRYRLLDLIGAGSMSRVWTARDEVLQRLVALKEVIAPHWMPDAEKTRLHAHAVREARAAARLSHRHVVAVFDVLCEDDRPWIVMEHVPSRPLDVVLAEAGPMTPGAVAVLGLGLLSGLAAAHRAGVLHRDVKPQNVLIGDDGRVVLSDFGVAAVRDDTSATRTDVGVGTPQYVAPERARSGESTAAADMWSLGATLYTAVEGRPPYTRDTAMDTLAALAAADPDPMVLAGALRPVLDGLLRRDPRERADVAGARRALRAAAEADNAYRRPAKTPSRPPGPPAGRADPSRTVTLPGPERGTERGTERRAERRALRIVAAAVGAALLAVAGASAYAAARPSAETVFQPGTAPPSCAAGPSTNGDSNMFGPTALRIAS